MVEVVGGKVSRGRGGLIWAGLAAGSGSFSVRSGLRRGGEVWTMRGWRFGLKECEIDRSAVSDHSSFGGSPSFSHNKVNIKIWLWNKGQVCQLE